MANERLREAMSRTHIDVDTISVETDVDPKTVQRWLKGRIPHARHRWKIAAVLNEKESYLWPGQQVNNDCNNEVVATYGRRSDASSAEWWELFNQAQDSIDMLGHAILFIPEQNSRLIDMLKEKVANGCRVRIAISNPDSKAVQMRDEEEGLGGTLPGRIRQGLYHFRGLMGTSGAEIRYHETILYNSLFRGDGDMFVTPHVHGLHGSMSPMIHIRRLGDNGIYATFRKHFEDVWGTTKPIE